MLRTRASNHVFASVLEPHGMFEPVRELSSGATGRIQTVHVVAARPEGTVLEITGTGGLRWVFMASSDTTSVRHTVQAGPETYSWAGHAELRRR